MRQRIFGSLLAGIVMVGAPAAVGSGQQLRYQHFLGLWEGVDVNDGSKRTISITDRDEDGVFEVSAHDSYWTLCNGSRGIEIAAGGVSVDGVLTTDGLVTCFETGIPVPVQQTYEYSRRVDTLFVTPHGTSLFPITLHRVSR